MKYVMSDIHGCYEEYLEALQVIDFKDEDTLYVLGDVIDRGPDSMKILLDMMSRSNVFPLIGNHEYMAMKVLGKFGVEITLENAENHLDENDMMNYLMWTMNGGQPTIKQFLTLDRSNQEAILDYLGEFSLYEEINVNGVDYVFVHAGFEPFVEGKPLRHYRYTQMLFKSPGLHQTYFKDKVVVVGHTPTLLLDEPYKGRIYSKNNIISIDCGCVFGGRLGIYCLDNGKEYYVEGKRKDE